MHYCKIKNLFAPIVLFSLLFACNNSHYPNPFTLKGSTSGIENGTPVYLLDLLNNQIIDSTVIRNNKFVFRGSLEDSPSKMVLMTGAGSVSEYLWLEPGELLFDASADAFADAILSGSETQKVFAQFASQIDSLNIHESVLGLVSTTIHDHPDSRVGVDLLSQYFHDMPRQLVDSLFQMLSAENRLSVYGERVERYLELNKNLKIGDPFVDFEMKNITGQTIRLSENLGQTTLLHFWASWCDSCRIENQILVDLYSRYEKEGLVIFSVSLDYEKSKWEEAVEKDQLRWAQVSTLDGRNNTAALIYGVNHLPDNFLIDKTGIIVARNMHGEALCHGLEKARKK